jgi:hypothetical protein
MTPLHTHADEENLPRDETPIAIVPDRAAYREAAALLRAWMDEEGDYDERAWPEVEAALARDPVRMTEESE